MSVRAKFVVESKVEVPYRDPSKPGPLATVTLRPVTDGSEENKSFYEATPGGSITLSTVNAAAAKQFEEGKAYYVDFTPAEG